MNTQSCGLHEYFFHSIGRMETDLEFLLENRNRPRRPLHSLKIITYIIDIAVLVKSFAKPMFRHWFDFEEGVGYI